MKIKVKQRDYSLLDVLELLTEYEDRLVRRMSQETLNKMTHRSEFDKESPSVIVKVFKTYEHKEKGDHLHMVFSNHGLIPMCDNDVLTDFKLDDPLHFWDYQIPSVSHRVFPEDVVFSKDADAHADWQASLNFETIFDTHCLDGGQDHAMFAFFVL